MSFRAASRKLFFTSTTHTPARADVLLRAGVDQRELRHVHAPPHEVARHVADQRHGAHVGPVMPLGPEERVVARQVHVGGLGVELQLVLAGDAGVALVDLGRRGDAGLAHALGLLEGLLGPAAGHDVVRAPAGGEVVHRHHRELHARAALEEEHLVVGGDGEQLAGQRDRLVVHGLVRLAAVAVLHDRHARALEVDELALRALEGGEGEAGGAGVEVVARAMVFSLGSPGAPGGNGAAIARAGGCRRAGPRMDIVGPSARCFPARRGAGWATFRTPRHGERTLVPS